VSILKPLVLWECREHGLMQRRTSTRACPFCKQPLTDRVAVIPEEELTQAIQRAVEAGRRQERVA
jgi:hypothetical protein